MEKLISQSEFARRKNCSKQYVSQLVRSGRITLVNGKIDPVLAEKQIQQTADPNHPKNLNKEESGNYNRVYNQAKTKILYLEGKIEKVKFELRTGLRIPIQDVEKSIFEISRLTRNAYLSLAEFYTPKFEGATTSQEQVEVIHQLNDDINEIIETSRKSTLKFVRKYQSHLTFDEVDTDE
ncbi:MAG: hypothetical protein HN790_05700 [Methylococcales bacterium]|nr:hypothetical protein [Methylococcales bacterium]